ncbi:hypothetical protein [Mariniblastus fucicola]|uniref:hypothetical protein n=1 Tax=Mariniblastus fucicola TaxID=980251 RepID=UPI000946378C|nr:hypothetical protein [Mariniblastus fucicola]
MPSSRSPFFWPKAKWIAIKHDDGAYVGGVPAPGDHVEVFATTDTGEIKSLARDLVVLEHPDWKFTDGIAMRLKLQINWRQQWSISGYKHYRIAISSDSH